MRSGWLVAVMALGGCDGVFGLTREPLPPNCRVTDRLPPSADTYLVDETPHGSDDILVADPDHPALLKFYLTGANLMPTDTITAAVIHATIATRGDACGGTCGLCPVNEATRYQLYWMTSSWYQANATMRYAENGVPMPPDPGLAEWSAPGASGGADRSSLVADKPVTADVTRPGEIEFEISEDATDPATGNPATPWLTNAGRLAIQLRADHRLAITSLERFDNSNCADMVPQPTLTLTICAP